MADLIRYGAESREIATLADAEIALKTIAVAEAAETIWARAKDPAKLYEAVEVKLNNQAAYAVWRQNVVVPSAMMPGAGRGKGKRISGPQSSNLPAIDPGALVVHRWRQRLCAKIEARWIVDKKKLSATLEDAQLRCVRVCEQENLGTIRGTEGTGEFERYTPAFYIEKAREVLGDIDLDPATSEAAQKTVRAARYFTVADNGLDQLWHGRVWLNPPYHRELAPLFIEKLVAEFVEGRVDEAIVLTNNSTDTEWFKVAATVCQAICFTTGRIHFEVPDRPPVMPTQGQAFFYFGANMPRFADVFQPVGLCLRPV